MTAISITDFPQIPANKKSLAMRRPLLGVGVNDAPYMVAPKLSGKMVMCPFYRAWNSMMVRCYSAKRQEIQPTYIGCTVAQEWLYFMTFRAWMVGEGWHGMHLDKDILFPGNKIYGPEFCVFVDVATNSLLTDHAAKRGKWPVGVCFHKPTNKFAAQCCVEGKGRYIGLFDTPEQAHAAYCVAKAEAITICAMRQPDPRVKMALMAIVSSMIYHERSPKS